MLLHLGNRCLVDKRPGGDAGFRAVAYFQLLYRLGELAGEDIINGILHQNEIGADAGLPGVAVFGHHGALNGGVEIGIVEDDEGRIAAKFEADFFDRRRALGHEHAADFGRAGKCQGTDDRIRSHLGADFPRCAGDDRKDARWHSGAFGKFGQRQCGERRFRSGLADKGAACGKRWTRLASDHGIGKIPRRNRCHDAHRLLDYKNARGGKG